MSTVQPEPWDQLAQRVASWIEDDPDAQTSAQLSALLTTASQSLSGVSAHSDGSARTPREESLVRDVTFARADLADRFSGLLQFGTAGLRGQVGGGPHRMNRAVVIRAASGLAGYLLGELDGLTPAPRVVVGYDARHRSADFARDTAAVLTAVGIEALVLPSALPTPVLAFAVRHLDADAGVMVTASHNPPQDNGYKVYLGGRVVTGSGQGSQIVPPADAAIAAEIARVPSVAAVPRSESGWSVLGPDVLDAYVASVTALADPTDEARARAGHVRIVLTPMHGVGGVVGQRVLAAAGFTDVHIVPEQAEPDPDFPSIPFPNPEEVGAIDLATGLAADLSADVVIALDPDADRCGVAVRDPRARSRSVHGPDTAAADGWRMLHGDEVGALLGRVAADRALRSPDGTDGMVLASSIVSSRQLAQIAASAGLRHVQTLTGFKWISRVDGLVYGYEEAIGYCVDPAHVRDKDGISAALLVASFAAELKASGRTLLDALDDLARAHNLYLSSQLAGRFADPAGIVAAMDRLRAAPPTSLGGSPVVEVVDLASGTEAERGGLPPTEGVRLLAEDGTRVIVRPSGTEPKVKSYLEVIVPVTATATDDELTAARTTAHARLESVRADMVIALGL
ncbi:MAG: phospho-sugar mutase [Cellulomonas sp.]